MRSVQSRFMRSVRLVRLSAFQPRIVPRLVRFFALDANESHSDFTRKSKVSNNEELKKELAKIVKEHKVVLFMKGSPEEPRCGFSARVVKLLHQNGAEIHSVDVLSSEELRSTLKEFSSWPTFPQLYINGEFIGGCDITTQLHQEGELAKMLA